jgi:hypothetical protein
MARSLIPANFPLAAAIIAGLISLGSFGSAFSQPTDIPRTADGRPDFNGIWQAINTANWNIEPHAADFGPVVEMGAIGAIPAGLGIVEGDEIPYTPEAGSSGS